MGATGAMGATGPIGPQGPEGQQGLQGPAGTVLVVDGGVVVGPPGSSVIVTPIAVGTQPCPAGAVLYLDGGVVLTQPVDNRPVLKGYTTFVSTGAIGSRTVANSLCHAEYPGTHLCTQTEFRVSRSIQAIPGGIGAWLDYANASTSNDPDPSVPCNGFTAGTGGTYTSAIALPTGTSANNASAIPNCGNTLPLACCTSPSSVRLRGYTAFTSTGAIGSRTIANAKCNAEFVGTHLCNQTEFRVARSIQAIPGNVGAWLDYASGSTSTDPDPSVPCNGFTAGSGGTYTSAIALPTGTTANNTSATPNCGNTLPLACCD